MKPPLRSLVAGGDQLAIANDTEEAEH
jgi:hypothetical protein